MEFDHRHLPPLLQPEKSRALLADIEALQSMDEVVAVLREQENFFLWMAGNSPYLSRLLKRHGDLIVTLRHQTPDDVLTQELAAITDLVEKAETRVEVMRLLRHAKGRIALLAGLADLTRSWTALEVSRALSRFADLAAHLTICFLLRDAFARGRLREAAPIDSSGIIILGMGKHGAGELNYSSDIDLIFFYEPGLLPLSDEVEPSKFYVDLARDLRAILQDPTEDGYVFRVDLRLRPDPGSTPVALPIPAALIYYEGHGQNWERAAFIKARAVAGDIAAGEAFLKELSPFIWRRNLDFAAIEDVHSMKRQIHAVKGHAHITTAGHNIKLGRGGIREIEFFVQTQQLIAGGRDPSLRGQQTVEVLAKLAERGWILPETCTRLTDAYIYLREIEHRLQMRTDEQTHSLPRDDETLAQFANFAGYRSVDALRHELEAVLTQVAEEYSNLFEQGEELSSELGSLVFTGGEDDPETLETLTRMGFTRPTDISAIIRGWHTGRIRATRSARAREMLTRLKPRLLSEIARTGQPDDTLLRFDHFISGLPAGIQLFSMFQANPSMLALVIRVIGVAPRLATWLSRNANLLDVMLDEPNGAFLEQATTTHEALIASQNHIPPTDIMARLDRTRLFVHDWQFVLGTRVLNETMDAPASGRAFSVLAEAAIIETLDAALCDIRSAHGDIPGGALSILGMGKLGSQEMTMTSDLDIIIICHAPNFMVQSDGPKPLDADQWFARAARRFLSGLQAPTAQGALYHVDTRLRPSGNAGPVVVKLSGFHHYQQNEAWTWEHMALTRARIVAGDTGLRDDLTSFIGEVVGRSRDLPKLQADISDMRQRIATHRDQETPWDVKLGRGGLFELEFLVQTLVLQHAFEAPEIMTPHTDRALRALHERGLIKGGSGQTLLQAWDVFSSIRQVLSLCVGPKNTDQLPPATEELLLRVTHQADVSQLRAFLAELRHETAISLDHALTP